MAQPDSRTTGHVKLIERQSGPKFYAKYRANGEQTTRLIGPAWLKRGRAPEGHFTRPMAEVELHRMMAEASNRRARGDSVTFEQACDEYLRYVEHVRQIDIATVKDYRGVIDGYLRGEFGELPIDAITPDLIDAYKERADRRGQTVGADDRPAPHGAARDLQAGGARLRARAATRHRQTSSSGRRSSTRASSTPSPGRRSSCSPAPPRTSRTRRSTGSPRSPGYGRASCWRCGGATWTSSAG